MQAAPTNTRSNFCLLPAELLDPHILCWLSLPSLIACSMTCRRLHKTTTGKITATIPKLHKSRMTFGEAVLKLLFAEGALQLAEWFEKYLHYPVFDNTTTTNPFLVECLCLAAKGTLVDSAIYCVWSVCVVVTAQLHAV